MIRTIAIQNYRCFRDQPEVELAPFTVLIGPNDTGKSSFLQALSTLFVGSAPPTDRSELWPGAQDELTITADFGHVRITHGASGASVERTNRALQNGRFFRLPAANGPVMTSQIVNDSRIQQLPKENGTGVPVVFDYLLRRDRPTFDAIVATLRGLIPGLREVNVTAPDDDRRGLELVYDSGPVDAQLASAGVRLILFFATLLHHKERPDVLLIEEPENGLHPKRLGDVVKALRSIAYAPPAYTKPSQVIVSTHSPHLLDFVDLDTDAVLVFSRTNGGACVARPIDREGVQQFLEADFRLGEIWFNRGDEKVVKEGA